MHLSTVLAFILPLSAFAAPLVQRDDQVLPHLPIFNALDVLNSTFTRMQSDAQTLLQANFIITNAIANDVIEATNDGFDRINIMNATAHLLDAELSVGSADAKEYVDTSDAHLL
jgi:hypothetical protein